MHRLRLILLACAAGLLLQALAAFLVPLPPRILYVGHLLDRDLARAAGIGSPKLVILAGSNGAYSHRCQTMQAILGLPCVNGSVAVGIGLDYLFARWRPVLQAGDVVYMPMEPPQYTRTRVATLLGPESRLLTHGQWAVARQLGMDRQVAALFTLDLPTIVADSITALAVRTHFVDPGYPDLYNAEGDRVGHTRATAPGANGDLDRLVASEPSAADIANGYGARLIGDFVGWAGRHGVLVIGGLASGFGDVPLPSATIAAQAAIFEQHGGRFLTLPNHSRYPRTDFYDTRYHLDEGCQIAHSIAVATALAPMIGRVAGPAPEWAARADCPTETTP